MNNTDIKNAAELIVSLKYSSAKVIENEWDKMYNNLKNMLIKGELTLKNPLTSFPADIKNWISWQRRQYVNNNLSKYRINKLEMLKDWRWRGRN